MKIIFISSYYNHHQYALSKALAKYAENFCFVETAHMSEERRRLGYGEEPCPKYVYHWQKEPDRVRQLLNEADMVIAGNIPRELHQQCISQKKILFRYMERPLKKGSEPLKYLPRLAKWHMQNPYGRQIYLLSASAYSAGDFAKFGLFKNRSYKWGYFPETKRYMNPEQLIADKNKKELLWCGRFLEWKHPDDILKVAYLLKKDRYVFHINYIGCGQMEEALNRMVEEMHLDDCVTFLGVKKPAEVRRYMEQTGIFLFTSDRQEGWGAVLNEAMNSGCAVIGSHAAGAVPYLIQDKKNGLIYRNGDLKDLYNKIKYLLDNIDEQNNMGREAYNTITKLWNADIAAQRLIELVNSLRKNKKFQNTYKEGPCSAADIIKEDWY